MNILITVNDDERINRRVELCYLWALASFLSLRSPFTLKKGNTINRERVNSKGCAQITCLLAMKPSWRGINHFYFTSTDAQLSSSLTQETLDLLSLAKRKTEGVFNLVPPPPLPSIFQEAVFPKEHGRLLS